MRKLVSIQAIKNTSPIAGADFIEKVSIQGWFCVAKKGEFKPGDLCVYFEIDSLLPDREEFEFLRKSSWKEKLGKYRLRTAKLKGVISQGLCLPIDTFPELRGKSVQEGDDLTEILQVEKYEPPIPAVISGEVRSFSWPVAKTDEERVQSNPDLLTELQGKPYVVTCKLDGTSSSYILLMDEEGSYDFHVCGRNYSYREDDKNTHWQIARQYDLKTKLIDYHQQKGVLLAIQGELCGPSIQSNRLGLKEADLFVFNMVNVSDGKRLSFDDMAEICSSFGLRTVPLLERGDAFDWDQETILAKAEGKYKENFPYASPKQEREGIVIRSAEQNISFKGVSNRFLLKGGD